jgi:SAM-dependent methyltransferase
MDLNKIKLNLETLAKEPALYETSNLMARAEALDLIAFVNQIMHKRRNNYSPEDLTALQEQTASLKHRLEIINEQLFQDLRYRFQASYCSPESLRHLFNQYTDYSPNQKGQVHIGYDGLDILVNGFLQTNHPPKAIKDPQPEMIHYEPTPARVVLDLVDHVGFKPDDVFYDLGSGLGQIVILVNLLTGVRARGIEFEPVYCDYANLCARRLGLSRVDFINIDAREADYSDGTIFFMFTPFKGKLLQTVLNKLKRQAQARSIKICTYGTCTLQLAEQPWLKLADPNANHEYKLAIFDRAATFAFS